VGHPSYPFAAVLFKPDWRGKLVTRAGIHGKQGPRWFKGRTVRLLFHLEGGCGVPLVTFSSSPGCRWLSGRPTVIGGRPQVDH
jgi:hypothetical protein